MVTLLAAALLAAAVSIGCDGSVPGPAPSVPPGIVYGGGDGSSIEHAVVIEEAAEYEDGITAEYAWLARQFPRYRFHSQSLVPRARRRYDAIDISTRGGARKVIYFDITDLRRKQARDIELPAPPPGPQPDMPVTP